MSRFKNETLSIRTTAEIKDLPCQTVGRERRSVASIIEAPVVNYARRHGLSQTAAAISETSRRKAQKK